MGIFSSIGRGLRTADTAVRGVFDNPQSAQGLLTFASALTSSQVPTPASMLAAGAQQNLRSRVFQGALAEEAEAQRNKTGGVSSVFRDALTPQERVQFEQMRRTRLFEPLEMEKARTDIEQGKTASIASTAAANNFNSLVTERNALLETEKKIKEATASQILTLTKKYNTDINDIKSRVERMKAMTLEELKLIKAQTAQAYASAYKLTEGVGNLTPQERALQITRVQDQLYQVAGLTAAGMGIKGGLVTNPDGTLTFKFQDPTDQSRLEEYMNLLMEKFRASGYNPDILINTKFSELFNSKKVPDVSDISPKIFGTGSDTTSVFTQPDSTQSKDLTGSNAFKF